MDNAQEAIAQNHALLAGRLERWADQVDDPGHPQMYGFTDALRTVAVHLRKGDYTPEGAEYHLLLDRDE